MSKRTVYDPTDPAFRLENSPFYLIAHADFRYHQQMDEALQHHGVSKPIYRIMTVLRERQPVSIGTLADVALTKRSTVSRIVDRMVDQGLAATAPNDADSRITDVTLTDAGQRTLDKLTPVVGEQLDRAFAGIAEADMTALLSTLRRISSNLAKADRG
ncbi:MarR family winged helix-turn-helix transcriptional regulator [Sphingomonas baiyangensis]|uniref:MarR family transcriptional regulator n=1 Tax=Sphingomonas baiyangensis TaxID=2572576 RepID=A0A4U1L4I9_9SPHN|nr:MarR family transcriptional regulator [Sphingomonas baiyangensis]TKD51086.1 MarR family transcriptional regulator [Sphingomonas baiyangensis]